MTKLAIISPRPIALLSTIFLSLSCAWLSACDQSPVKTFKALTEDKYPVADMADEPLAEPLDIIIEPKRLAMTSSWSAGVKDDGSLWTWGSGRGILRKVKGGVDPTPRQVEGVSDAVAVSGGANHMFLLKKDGTVWGWGSNSSGQIYTIYYDTFI